MAADSQAIGDVGAHRGVQGGPRRILGRLHNGKLIGSGVIGRDIGDGVVVRWRRQALTVGWLEPELPRGLPCRWVEDIELRRKVVYLAYVRAACSRSDGTCQRGQWLCFGDPTMDDGVKSGDSKPNKVVSSYRICTLVLAAASSARTSQPIQRLANVLHEFCNWLAEPRLRIQRHSTCTGDACPRPARQGGALARSRSPALHTLSRSSPRRVPGPSSRIWSGGDGAA
jgi:hypothetical protein